MQIPLLESAGPDSGPSLNDFFQPAVLYDSAGTEGWLPFELTIL